MQTSKFNNHFNFSTVVKALALAGVLSTSFLITGCGGGSGDETPDPLRFNPTVGGKQSVVNVYGKPVTYTTYTVSYVTKPNAPEKQVMAIYVPSNATSSSPIFMPLKTGAYLEVNILEPAEVTESNINTPSTGTLGTGATHASALALARGMVVVSPAARGRNTTVTQNGVATEVGNAPAAIVDLKAAVRYLKYNDAFMLGDANKIVMSGTSGGGAYSSIMGATGDDASYYSYLDEIGAAKTSDSVFGVSPFCPITDLDNANEAYEYYFYGSGITTLASGVAISDQNQRLSLELAKLYPNFINGLGLKNPSTGAALSLNAFTADPAMGGSYKNYLISAYSSAATRFFTENVFFNADGALNANGLAYMNTPTALNNLTTGIKPADFLTWNAASKSVTVTSYQKFIQFVNRLKPVAAFDNGFFNVTAEMDNFSSDPTIATNNIAVARGWNHFDPNLNTAIANAGLTGAAGFTSVNGFTVKDSVAKLATMFNPGYYITNTRNVSGYKISPYAQAAADSSVVSKNWRIRVGSYDRDSSPFISLNLATALANKGMNVDYRIVWNQPHTGSYDNTDMIDWIENISK